MFIFSYIFICSLCFLRFDVSLTDFLFRHLVCDCLISIFDEDRLILSDWNLLCTIFFTYDINNIDFSLVTLFLCFHLVINIIISFIFKYKDSIMYWNQDYGNLIQHSRNADNFENVVRTHNLKGKIPINTINSELDSCQIMSMDR